MPKITDNGIDYLQSQMNEEHETERRQISRYDRTLRDIPERLEKIEEQLYTTGFKSEALQKAIDAINAYQEKRTRK